MYLQVYTLSTRFIRYHRAYTICRFNLVDVIVYNLYDIYRATRYVPGLSMISTGLTLCTRFIVYGTRFKPCNILYRAYTICTRFISISTGLHDMYLYNGIRYLHVYNDIYQCLYDIYRAYTICTRFI